VSNKQKDGNLPGEETVINGKTYMVRQLTMRKWFDLEALWIQVSVRYKRKIRSRRSVHLYEPG
jgi:hypothetical protein